jgi:hypothetical protein
MNRFGFRWIVAVLAMVMLAGVGFYSYNLGVAHGIAESGRIAAAPVAGGVPTVVYWPHPWGFGFFPFFPLLFFFLFFFVLRGLFWRAGCWGGRYRYYDGVPPAFEEWHRRAHAEQPPKA